MSLHTIAPQPVTDPRARNPRTLAHDLAAARADLEATRADLRRLSRGRAANDPRATRRAERARAALAHAEAEVDRLAAAVRTSGGRVRLDTQGHAIVTDRRGRIVRIM